VLKAIVGGSPAAAGTEPWLAFVEDSQGPDNESCTGTVVSANVILTAGHCAENTTTATVSPPSGYTVVTGSLDWTDASTRDVSGVSRVIVYPGFNPETVQGDAALLVLSTPTTAPPLPLATASDAGLLAPGTLGTITGWGETVAGDVNSLPAALRWAPTVVQSTAYCNQNVSAFDPATQICAINTANDDTSTCFGDSGGPLLANDLAGQNGNPTEIGIASEVEGECDTTFPDIFARVDAISSWADGVIAAVAPRARRVAKAAVQAPPRTPPLAGLYRGTTRQGWPITLRVGSSRHSITALDFSYGLTCRVHHHHLAYEISPLGQLRSAWAISKSKALGFSDGFRDITGGRYQIGGTFSTSGHVSGTLKATSRTRRYGACASGTVRWQATRKTA
jgi:secreted trypsin-like serine protease